MNIYNSLYILLTIVTFFVIYNVYKFAKITNTLVYSIVLFVMYFWSIMGAWSWIQIKNYGIPHYYESEMFPVNIDSYYFLTILIYSVFIALFTWFSYTSIRKSVKNIIFQNDYVYVLNRLGNSKLYITIILSCFLIFVLMNYRDIIVAIRTGSTAYEVGRFESETGNLHSAIQFFGDTFVCLIVPLFFATISKKKTQFIYLLMAIYYIVNFLLGNRSQLLISIFIIIQMLVLKKGVKQVFRIKYIVPIIFLLVLVQAIAANRGTSTGDLLAGDFNFNLVDLFLELFASNEMYASQFSMYGTLVKDLDITWGTSILYFISTLVPSFMGVPRPDSIYLYYIKGTTGSIPTTGFTIHHATAWYLNFGFIGIILGALLWSKCLSYFFIRRNQFLYMYGAILFSSVSIQMIRAAGPEAYKGCLLLSTIIPLVIINYCSKTRSGVII